MGKRFVTVLLIGAAIGLFTGCAKRVTEVGELPVSEEILRATHKNTGVLRGFKAKSEITIESGFRRITVQADIYYRHPDWLTLRAYAPMGMKLVELSLQKQRFMIYSPFTNEYVTGALDSVNFSRRFKLPLPNYDLREVWSELYSGVGRGNEPARINRLGKYYVLSFEKGNGFKEIWIHRSKKLIFRENRIDSTGAVKRYLAFSRYKKKSGANFPRRIEIGDIDLGVKLTIETGKFDINPDFLEAEMMLSVPPDVNRIELRGGRED